MTLLAGLSLVAAATAQEEPDWKVETKESDLVGFEALTWHAKDYGWLLTFRLTTPAEFKLRPVSHVRFEGSNAQEEIVWEDSKTIRRKDLDSSLSGSEQMFVRMLLKDVPEEVEVMRIRFDNGDEKVSSSESD